MSDQRGYLLLKPPGSRDFDADAMQVQSYLKLCIEGACSSDISQSNSHWLESNQWAKEASWVSRRSCRWPDKAPEKMCQGGEKDEAILDHSGDLWWIHEEVEGWVHSERLCSERQDRIGHWAWTLPGLTLSQGTLNACYKHTLMSKVKILVSVDSGCWWKQNNGGWRMFILLHDHCLLCWRLAVWLSEATGHFCVGPPKTEQYCEQFWQKAAHWRGQWPTTAVFSLWEPHEL